MSLLADVFGLPNGKIYSCHCITGPGRHGCTACGAPGWDTSPPPAMFTNTNTTITTRRVNPEKPEKRVPASRAEEV